MSITTITTTPAKVKVVPADEIRRMQLQSSMDWSEFAQRLSARFGDSLPESYRVQYKDEDGDLITMQSTEELQNAIKYNACKTLDIVITSAQPEECHAKVSDYIPREILKYSW